MNRQTATLHSPKNKTLPATALVFQETTDINTMCTLYFLKKSNDLGKKVIIPAASLQVYSDKDLKLMLEEFSSPLGRVAKISSGKDVLANKKNGGRISLFSLPGLAANAIKKKINPNSCLNPENVDAVKLLLMLSFAETGAGTKDKVKILIHWPKN